MKLTVFALALIPSIAITANAMGTTKVISSETREVVLNQTPQFPLSCEAGRGGHRFPTPSALLLNGVNLFSNTQLDHLVYLDAPNTGDTCSALVSDFTSRLPAKLTVTLTKSESCYEMNSPSGRTAHKLVWQNLSGHVAGYEFGTGNEVLSDEYIENGTCQ